MVTLSFSSVRRAGGAPAPGGRRRRYRENV